MGGRPGWAEGACSADAGGGGAGVCAAPERSGRAALSPGSGPECRAGRRADPGSPWERAAGAAHFERPAAGSGEDAGLHPGCLVLREALRVETGRGIQHDGLMDA